MKALESLERQLRARNTGVARRRSLIARTRQRLQDENDRDRAELARLERAIAERESALAQIEDIERREGTPRSGGGVAATAEMASPAIDVEATAAYFETRGVATDRKTFAVDASFPFERSEDGMLWKFPIQIGCESAGEFRPLEPEIDLARASHADRALAIPGYAHLAYLAQLQWLGREVLDDAVALATRRGVIGHEDAPDLVNFIVDGAAAGEKGEDFWRERAERLRQAAPAAASDS